MITSPTSDLLESLNTLAKWAHPHTEKHTQPPTHSCSSSGALAETQTPARRGWTVGAFQRSALVQRERRGCYTPTSWWPLWSPRSPGKRPLPQGRGPASPVARGPGPPCRGSVGSKCPGSHSDSPGWTDLLLLAWKEEWQRHEDFITWVHGVIHDWRGKRGGD